MGLWQAGKEKWVGIDDKETTKAGSIDLSNEELSKIDEIGRGATDYLDEDPVMWNL